MRTLLSLLFVALLVGFSGAVVAKTPDGEPPSVETVCDPLRVLKGALFGLCNAYCEAMDCGHPNQRAAQRACDQVLANYEKQRAKRGGPEMPCLEEECVCDEDLVFVCQTASSVGEPQCDCLECRQAVSELPGLGYCLDPDQWDEACEDAAGVCDDLNICPL